MYGNIGKAGQKDNKTRYYYYCKNTVNATGHKCTFRRNIEQTQIDDMLAKLITAMTKEGKFKDAIQDKIGATVDTTDLEKQLSVLNASLHQAETIKTRLEQVKAKYGIIERENYNLPKEEDTKHPQCTKEKEDAIVDALRFFRMI